MWSIKIIVVLKILLNCICKGSDLDYDVKVAIRLDHSFDHTSVPVYFYRGNISISNGIATVKELDLTSEQINALKLLAKKGGIYRLRATAKTIDGKENYYYTFVKACSLMESYLNNMLSINVDHIGNIISISLTVPNRCTGADIKDSSLTTFDTNVDLRHMELGPVPDTATYIQKLEKEREAKERGETKDNRSFLGKYWMYIVPVVIFMLLSSATNPEAGGANAQR